MKASSMDSPAVTDRCSPWRSLSMNGVTRRLGFLLAGAVLANCGACLAQQKPSGYPTRPLRIVISGCTGAGGDMMARAVAQIRTDAWGQNAVVDNRPGGG